MLGCSFLVARIVGQEHIVGVLSDWLRKQKVRKLTDVDFLLFIWWFLFHSGWNGMLHLRTSSECQNSLRSLLLWLSCMVQSDFLLKFEKFLFRSFALFIFLIFFLGVKILKLETLLSLLINYWLRHNFLRWWENNVNAKFVVLSAILIDAFGQYKVMLQPDLAN